jgi:hypothetical protein
MMDTLKKHIFLISLLMVLLIPAISPASTLDSYYLTQFDSLYNKHALLAGVEIQSAASAENRRCLTPLYHDLRRDWTKLDDTTKTRLAKYVTTPAQPMGQVYISPAGHFAVHYVLSGAGAPELIDKNGNGVPDWVETVAETFEHVFAVETAQMGYRAAVTMAAAPYDVYLVDFSGTGIYGYTDTTQPVASNSNAYASYIAIDKSYIDSSYAPYSPINALQVTAAHEYHHAIQYSYNRFSETWIAEATSTWMEDEVYDGVNQLYTYLPNYFRNSTFPIDAPASITTGGGYGRWAFNRFLAEKYGGASIRTFWENMGVKPVPADGEDIPALPALVETILTAYSGNGGEDFFAFAKRLYTKDWATHQNDVDLIHDYIPKAIYSVYPVNSATVPIPQTSLSHYSFAYYKFVPSASAPADLVLTLTKSAEVALLAFRKKNDGTILEYRPDPTAKTITIPDFNSPDTVEAALLLCNTTTLDALAAGFTTDGSAVSSSPSLASDNAAKGGEGGGNGCFIATAAYGCYLHPKVMVLREFRDTCLLTNPPGRAFVTLYYRISPPLASLIAKHESARAVCRMMLAPVIVAVEYKKVVVTLLLIAVALLVRRKKLSWIKST